MFHKHQYRFPPPQRRLQMGSARSVPVPHHTQHTWRLLPREVVLDYHLLQPSRDAAAAGARCRGQVVGACKLPTARGAQSCVDVPQDSRQRPQLGYDALQRHGKGGRCEPGGHLGRPNALEPPCSKSLSSQSEMQARPPLQSDSVGLGRGREPRNDKLHFYQLPGYLWDGGNAHRKTH